MGWFRHLPLSRKILLGILPLFLLFISASVILQNHFQEREMMEQARESARTYADLIKESLVSMMVTNYEVDNGFLDRLNHLQQFDSVHVFVNVLHLREELLTPNRIERLESKYKSLRSHDAIEREVIADGEPRFTLEGNHFRGVIPFTASKTCQKCHAVPIGYTLGAADLHISLEGISRVAAGNWKRSILIFFLFTGLVVATATFMFTRYVSKPIDQLVVATKEISRGNLNYKVTPEKQMSGPSHRSRDELAFLARMFDAMRESLQEKIHQLDRVNADLVVRNAELEEALRQLKLAQEDLVRSERLATTGKMTAQLSHEINNPIHNIQSLLESSLRKVNGNDQAQELITIALEEVSRMAKLTRQMLDFYRGSLDDVAHQPVDMRSLLHEVDMMHRESLVKQNIRLRCDVAVELPLVPGSRDKLKQVFINLLSNARDAMPSGGTIVVAASVEQDYVTVTVTDSGIGIAQSDLGKIFDAFYTTKKERSGVGLGLSVTYGIIRQHKGVINVKSTPGRGTTFTIQLPSMSRVNDSQTIG